MKDKGIYEDCSMVCYPRLNSKILKDEIEKEIWRVTWGVMQELRIIIKELDK